jgi:membrane protease subunit HflC
MRNLFLAVAAAVLFTLWSSLFVVTEKDRALVTRFGEITKVADEPGLYFKLPFVETVIIVDKRLRLLENQNQSVQVIDSRRYVVDAITMYRVVDPRKFRESAQASFDLADKRIGPRVDAALRQTYGKRTFQAALSEERHTMMNEIRDQVRTETKDLGVEIVDVRIRRTDLPHDADNNVLEQTYNRMRSERQAEATQIRAIGNQKNITIKAEADRNYTVTLANAQRDASILRGQGEAERNRIFAEAFQKDPEFFAFYRSMQAYADSLSGADTTFVLKPDSEFFTYFNGAEGAPAAPAP